ncbi:uncharacterized protein LTR77_001708 [Saxophila tyrrhenica]|uniref:Uncharacterized protein n=1 Tax=Saxophila tyrrhenica TaxID=1690608 RepID=A0AAV9PQM3_9PEZI|nr:hypothetical protein LTR77_001708 [Saxophila tyrrhenica]
MIPRTIGLHSRSLRPSHVFEGPATWPWSNGGGAAPALEQRRGLKKPKQAPLLRQKAGKNNWSRVTPEEIKRIKEYEARRSEDADNRQRQHNVGIKEVLERAQLYGKLRASPSAIMDFLVEFEDLMEASLKSRAGGRAARTTVPVEEYRSLRDKYGLDDNFDIVWGAVSALLRNDEKLRRQGKLLLFAASDAGSWEATLRIMNHAFVQALDRPSVLDSSELAGPRQRLFELAKMGSQTDFRILTLAGLIAKSQGQSDRAIAFWDDALVGAEAWAEEHGSESAPERDSNMPHLFSPWIELAAEHLDRRNFREAEQAIKIGCRLDDPTSHFNAALSHRRENAQNINVATSDWLFHMTKAASSGHVKAMHDLANYYITNYWPYLEDEVPDHLKPTPFDQYPPPFDFGKTTVKNARDGIRSALGYVATTSTESKDSVFHTAAFPQTVEGRLQMALQWFEVAMASHYAPSFLLAARVYLTKEIDSDLAVPEEAVKLREERYISSSKVDYDAGKRKQPPPVHKVKNPIYNPAKAKKLIREIFYADQAVKLRKACFDNRRKTVRVRDEPDDFKEVRQKLRYNVDKWFRSDFSHLFMNSSEGLLFDSSNDINDLLKEAEDECEQQGWDLYSEEDGGLLYRHGMRKR